MQSFTHAFPCMLLDIMLHHLVITFFVSANKEGNGLAVDNADDSVVVRSTMSSPVEDPFGPAPEHKDDQDFQDFDYEMCPISGQSKHNVKREGDDDNFRKHLISHSSTVSDHKNDEKLPNHISDQVNDTAVTNSSFCENKVQDINRKTEVLIDCHTNNSEEFSCDFGHAKQELEGSENTLGMQKGFLEIKDGSGYAEEPSKSETTLYSQKMLSCLGKSSSSSSIMNSKLLANDQKSEETEIPNSLTKHVAMADCNLCIKKESNPNDVTRDEVPRKSVRERPKSSSNPNLKAMHSSRNAQNSALKQVISDSKDAVNCSSSKASLVHQTAINSGSGESNASLLHQKALQASNKISSSAPQRGEKLNQTNFQPPSKVNQNHVPSPSTTSNSSAMLSDEEV